MELIALLRERKWWEGREKSTEKWQHFSGGGLRRRRQAAVARSARVTHRWPAEHAEAPWPSLWSTDTASRPGGGNSILRWVCRGSTSDEVDGKSYHFLSVTPGGPALTWATSSQLMGFTTSCCKLQLSWQLYGQLVLWSFAPARPFTAGTQVQTHGTGVLSLSAGLKGTIQRQRQRVEWEPREVCVNPNTGLHPLHLEFKACPNLLCGGCMCPPGLGGFTGLSRPRRPGSLVRGRRKASCEELGKTD